MKTELWLSGTAKVVAVAGLLLAAFVISPRAADAPGPEQEPPVVEPGPAGGPPWRASDAPAAPRLV